MPDGIKFTLNEGARQKTVTVLDSVTPEELLIWMSKAEMYYILKDEENPMAALPMSIKDQMIKPNVS